MTPAAKHVTGWALMLGWAGAFMVCASMQQARENAAEAVYQEALLHCVESSDYYVKYQECRDRVRAEWGIVQTKTKWADVYVPMPEPPPAPLDTVPVVFADAGRD